MSPIIPFIPESAPFSTAQRAWLNGFFAAVLSGSSHGTCASGLPASIAGLPTGFQSAEVAPTEPVEVPDEDFPWHDATLAIEERLKLAEGQPRPLRLMSAMAQLNCGACGYLCRTYSKAIAEGEEKDLTRCTPGGADTAKALKQILAEASSADMIPIKVVSVSSSTKVNDSAGTAKYNRTNPYRAKLISSRQITHAEAPKDTRHVAIDLGDSGLTYEPGDSLGILPVNCPELVGEVLKQLHADGDEPVTVGPGDLRPLRTALSVACNLTRTRPETFELLALHAKSPSDRQKLSELGRGEANEFAVADLAEVLEHFPSARPPVNELFGSLARLQPRLYSISSSLRAHPGEVHLTVGVVRFESRGRWRNGVASHFLGVRCLPGDEVPVYVQPSARFRLPTDPTTPIIMIGPGTGIAPFRAFLEERQSLGLKGPAWLFFGNQHFEYDFLYRDELSGFMDRGVLTKLDLAFSRDQAEKIYVQNRMQENGAELWRWLEEGAHFYVCGDAKRMAADVDDTLRAVIAKWGNRSKEEADAYVSAMAKSKRYHKDVY